MKKECRWARRRARAAEKHRAIGGLPATSARAKLNRAPRDGEPYKPMKSSPMYEKLVRDSTPSGGLAFHTEDSRTTGHRVRAGRLRQAARRVSGGTGQADEAHCEG